MGPTRYSNSKAESAAAKPGSGRRDTSHRQPASYYIACYLGQRANEADKNRQDETHTQRQANDPSARTAIDTRTINPRLCRQSAESRAAASASCVSCIAPGPSSATLLVLVQLQHRAPTNDLVLNQVPLLARLSSGGASSSNLQHQQLPPSVVAAATSEQAVVVWWFVTLQCLIIISGSRTPARRLVLETLLMHLWPLKRPVTPSTGTPSRTSSYSHRRAPARRQPSSTSTGSRETDGLWTRRSQAVTNGRQQT